MQGAVVGLQRGHFGVHRLGHGGGRGGRAFVDRQQHRAIFAHLGVAGVGVVGQLDIRDILQLHIAHAGYGAQHHIAQRIHAVVGGADLQHIAVAIGVVDVPGGHREVLRHNQLRQRCDVQKLVKVGVFQCLLAGGFVLLAGGVQLCLPCLQLGQTVGDLVLAQAQLRLAAAEQQLACQRPQRGVERVLHQPLQRGLQLGALVVQRFQPGVQLVNFCVEGRNGGGGVLLLLLQRQRGGKRRQVQLLFGQGGQVGAVVVFDVGAQGGVRVGAGALQRRALGGVRLRLLPRGGQRFGGVLRGVFRHDCQPLGVQLFVHRHADAGQLVGVQLEVFELVLQFLQLTAQFRHLAGCFGQLFVNFLYGVLQLGGHAVLLGGQLLLARLHLLLRVLQLFFGGVQLRLALVQLRLGICQTVADLHQQLVVDLVDFVLVQRDLHGLFHKPGRGNTRHAVHTLQLWQQRVFDIIGQFVDVHIVTADRNVLRGKHIGRHFDQHRGRAYAGQRIAQLVQRRAGLDHGAVHIGFILVL